MVEEEAHLTVGAREEALVRDPEEESHLCSICYEEADDSCPSVSLRCGHSFHPSCIVKWLQSGRNDCPLCRDDPSLTVCLGSSRRWRGGDVSEGDEDASEFSWSELPWRQSHSVQSYLRQKGAGMIRKELVSSSRRTTKRKVAQMERVVSLRQEKDACSRREKELRSDWKAFRESEEYKRVMRAEKEFVRSSSLLHKRSLSSLRKYRMKLLSLSDEAFPSFLLSTDPDSRPHSWSEVKEKVTEGTMRRGDLVYHPKMVKKNERGEEEMEGLPFFLFHIVYPS